MFGNVRHLGPARSLSEARGLFLSGRNRDVLLALGVDGSHAGRLLRGRSLLRLDEPEAAIELLHSQSPPDGPAAVVELQNIAAMAFARLGDDCAVQRCQEAAFLPARGLGGAALAETELVHATSALHRQRHDEVEGHVDAGLAVMEIGGDTYGYALGFVRAQLLQALACAEAGRARHVAELSALERAWLAQDASLESTCDAWIQAQLIARLSQLVADRHLPQEAAFLHLQLRHFPWTDELSEIASGARRALGWHAAVEGDYRRAFLLLRDAAADAPSPAARLAIALDREYLANELGNEIMAYEERAYAHRLAATIRWDAVFGEDANVLLALVEASAAEDARVARTMLGWFCRTRIHPRSGSRMPEGSRRRQAAIEDDAEGAVLAAEGSRAAAATLRRRATDAWTSLGCSWRAARSAIELAELTGEGDDVKLAQARARLVRSSWLYRPGSRGRSGRRTKNYGEVTLTGIGTVAEEPSDLEATREKLADV